MDAAMVSRTLSLIPDRVARAQSGCLFDPAAASAACAHPERIDHLVQFLTWLGPLQPLTKEDLRVFGLMTPYGRPASESALDGDAEAAGAELEEELDVDALPVTAADTPTERAPALT